jgi:hypothetical protein
MSETNGSVIVCAGGGKIGTAVAVRAAREGASVLVIDRDPGCEAYSHASRIQTNEEGAPPAGEISLVIGEVTTEILGMLDHMVPDELVPRIKGHLLARLLVEMMKRRGIGVNVCPEAVKELVVTLGQSVIMSDRENGVIVTSFMSSGELCEPGCGQPDTCPVTGRYRPVPMHGLVQDALEGSVDTSFVASAHTVAGFGGVGGDDLLRLREVVERGPDGILGVATCCRCHGIINLVRVGQR